MKSLILAAGMMAAATLANAEAEKYVLDASHSQIVFSYNHLGYSTTYGMFSGFEGEIMFDQDAPAESSVTVEFPVTTMFTGWEKRMGHFMSPGLFGASEDKTVRFVSTGIEVTGDNTALITGDLTMNEITKPVVLDAKLNKVGDHPQAGKPWAGFDATTTVLRSDYGVGIAVPFVSDEVEVTISIEAMKAG